jgi:hypothetical protein
MISETLRIITDNFTKKFDGQTLMGWTPKYDEQGRPLNCDPNYKYGRVNIEDKTYGFVRKGWKVRIWEGEVHYTAFMNDRQDFIEEVDLTPDYILERNKNSKNE